MRDAIPMSAPERWDRVAQKVRRSKPGQWVLVAEGARPRNEKIRRSLEVRGLSVEVTSRAGKGTGDRPWIGWRTWARKI